jgi:hypothetical protein
MINTDKVELAVIDPFNIINHQEKHFRTTLRDPVITHGANFKRVLPD